MLVVDSASEQVFETFLGRIVKAMGVKAVDESSSELIEPTRSLNDKPLYLARQFFGQNP